jgi:hypothetical protein
MGALQLYFMYNIITVLYLYLQRFNLLYQKVLTCDPTHLSDLSVRRINSLQKVIFLSFSILVSKALKLNKGTEVCCLLRLLVHDHYHHHFRVQESLLFRHQLSFFR